MKDGTLIKNAKMLTFAGVINKVIGAFYKIPLIKLLGSGLGVYSITYPLFMLMAVVALSSFPLGISKYISNKNNSESISECFFACVFWGVIASFFMVLFAKNIAGFQKIENYYFIYYFFAPIIFLMFVTGGLKGYFQGKQNMKVVAFSQVYEQIFKVVFGLLLCVLLFNQTAKTIIAVYIGIFIGEVICFLYLYFCFLKQNTGFKFCSLKIFKPTKCIFPFIVSNSILPLWSWIVSISVIGVINYITPSTTLKLFGYMGQVVNTIINLPCLVLNSVIISILPRIATINNKGEEIETATKFTYLFSSLFAFFVIIFNKELSFFMINIFNLNTEISVLSNYFVLSAVASVYVSFMQILNTVLQGTNKAYLSLTYIFIGVILRAILFFVLAKVPHINLNAIYLSEIIGTSLTVFLQSVQVKKTVNIKQDFSNLILKPLIVYFFVFVIVLPLKKYIPLTLGGIVFKGFTAVIMVGVMAYLLNIFNVRYAIKKMVKQTNQTKNQNRA